ncbi:MAG: hypothetical protein V4488_19770 [Pseudomonadota bacterium]
MASATVSTALVLAELMIACRKLGLGTVSIDGIRLDSQAMIGLLGLPPMTFLRPVAVSAASLTNR